MKKLTPEERSQVAKDRWAKIRAAKATTGSVELDTFVDKSIEVMSPDQLKDYQEKSKSIMLSYETKTYNDGTVATGVAPLPEKSPAEQEPNPPTPPTQPPVPPSPTPEQPPVLPESSAPAPQLASVKAPKQKRYTGPKEFSVALKAAEGRLAKAIVERAQAAGQLNMLQAEIPSLIQIINALKGQTNVPAVPYDPYGSVPNAVAFQAPLPQMVNGPQFQQPSIDLGAIQAAIAQAPASKASGGAIQFGPEVLGALEGPDDDDPDRFITGPAAGGGWFGG